MTTTPISSPFPSISLPDNERDAIGLLRRADAEYAKGQPFMSDHQYDSLYQQASQTFPHNPYFREVGSPDIAYEKAPHTLYLGSLKKLRPSEVAAAIKSMGLPHYTRWVVMDKLDGISLSLHYKQGKLIQALTRGTGTVGQDVTDWTRLIPTISMTTPSPKEFVVMGEAIIPRSKFADISSLGYVNARNAVAGAFRNKDFDARHRTLLAAIHFIQWRVWVHKDEGWTQLSESSRFSPDALRATMAEPVPLRHFMQEELTESLLTRLARQATRNAYCDCDGIVITPHQKAAKRTVGPLNTTLPKWAYAVKLDVADQKYRTGTVKDVNWTISIRGIYNPVCHLAESVSFNGVKVSRATLHNLDYVRKYKAGPGSKVTLVRSGDVIPRILSCTPSPDYAIPETCQHCGSPLKLKGAHLCCPNPLCSGVARCRFLHFIRCLSIDGINDESSLRLWSMKIQSVPDLLKASENDLAVILGPAKAKLLHKGLHNWKPGPVQLAYASGLFNSPLLALGEERLALVMDDVDGATIQGVGPKIKSLYKDRLPLYQDWLEATHLKPATPTSTVNHGPLEGMSFAFTGFRDKQLEQTIRENGGKVESVKKTTTALFGQAGSTKAAKAEKYGIPVISPDEATSHIGSLIGKEG